MIVVTVVEQQVEEMVDVENYQHLMIVVDQQHVEEKHYDEEEYSHISFPFRNVIG